MCLILCYWAEVNKISKNTQKAHSKDREKKATVSVACKTLDAEGGAFSIFLSVLVASYCLCPDGQFIFIPGTI